MPQEEEVDDRGENGSIQPTDSGDRDRLFAQFSEATDLDQILSSFQALCQETQVDASGYESVYPSLKAGLTAWKPLSIWELLDARAKLAEYESQNACRGRRVLVVGAGPVGLRMAIEAALLGARVDLVEKRCSFSRSNSLHLWPFLITDLRNLGAKKFYGRFATGSLDHICIRILQSILVKVCLILGVRVHVNVTFSSLVEPTASTGWRVSTQPPSCPVNTIEFDAILAADGKKNSLPGFKLKEFRAKLALAITANFVNGNTQNENSVPEISGVSYVYSMEFFNSLSEKFGIELENIVYYKDETHYFVMTAKKPSLLKKGVLKKDYNDPKQLLSPSNIDTTALKKYTVEAASFSTKGALPLTFLKNYKGEDDVALFDFTSLFASENAARIVERKGRRILLCVAGDSLNEPFWPTGSGCGRGFLGAFDAAWMLKRYCGGTSPLELVEEREALFYLLPQTTPERLAKNLTGYTIDPKTRYPNLSELVPPGDVSHLYDTDNLSAKPSPQVNQSRQLAPAPAAKEPTPPPLTKAATVSGGLGRFGGKRSRSSEDLSAISEMTQPRKTESPSRRAKKVSEHGSQEASVEENPASLQEKINMFKAREGAPASSHKPPRNEKKKKKEKDVQPMETSSPPKPSMTKEGAAKNPESPKSKQKGFRRLLRSKSKSPSPNLSSEDESKEKENTKQVKVKKVRDSPKKAEDVQPRPAGHPLSVNKQAKTSHPESPSTEAKQKNKNKGKRADDEPLSETATASVANIVKRLNPQQPSTEQPTEKSKKKEKAAKKEGKAKEKEKQQAKGGKVERKEKEGEGKSGGRFSFFKSKKSYDVSKASSQPTKKSSASPKLKKKKKGNNEKQAVQQVSTQSMSLQQRMERLRELGVGRTDTDSSELVLSLEELRDLELSRGLILEEEDTQQVKDARETRSKSPAGQSEDGLESEQSNRSRSSTPVCSSGAEEQRPQSRTSRGSTGAATYGTSSRGVSPVQGEWRVGTTSGEEEGSDEGEQPVDERVAEEGEFTLERTPSVVETVRLLEPLSAAYSYDQIVTRRQAEERKSKEFELAELHRQSTADSSSNPLWLARIIQGMGKCLERLRKEQESILATKTTLQIINTILSNVQLHPSDDTYRRVRVSSQRFNQKVWQFSNAAQFLARAGWVEIGDFIVLPMGQTVDNAKRVLDKHLNIVNQMLWSQQLELPDSPGVLKKMQERPAGATRRHRTITAAMVARRQSYSSRIVAETLMEVEEEQEAIEAELVRMNSSTQSKDRESSPDPFDTSEVGKERAEEFRTMKAASAARNKWLERQRKESFEQRKDREYKLILESELYDLPQSTLTVPAESSSSLASPSPTHSLSVTPDPRSTSPSTTSPTAQDTCVSPDVGKEVEEKTGTNGVEETSSTSPNATSLPGQPTDAQYSTPDSIRQDMMAYEKITLEAAAQVRQKWTET